MRVESIVTNISEIDRLTTENARLRKLLGSSSDRGARIAELEGTGRLAEAEIRVLKGQLRQAVTDRDAFKAIAEVRRAEARLAEARQGKKP
jgi:uncharacterized protein YdcH (DUF465 family)